MILRFCLLGIFVLLPAMLLAQPAGSPPPLQVEPPSWDFGKIRDSKMVRHDFVLTNHTDRPVKIIKALAACGCMIAKVNPALIPPKGQGKLIVIFQPKGRLRAYEWQIRLKTDLPGDPLIAIPMKAYILREGLLSQEVIYFRNFKRGTQKPVDIWMACHQQPDFKLLKAYVTIPGFQVSFEATKVEGFYPGPQRGYHIRVQPRADIEYGRHSGHLELITNLKDKTKQKIRLPLFAYISGDITAAPDLMALGLLKPGAVFHKRIIVSHNQFSPFKITKLECNLPFIKLHLKMLIPHKYYYVLVDGELPTDTPAGEIRGKIYIHTDYAQQPKLKVILRAMVIKAGK